MPITLGTVLDDRYKIIARIGHGGMAEIYEAVDVINKRTVAVKLIREDIMKDPINLRRFQNEANFAASLSHPNIVSVYNHGTYQGRPYIVNEYMKGQTLKDVLDFRGSLPINETIGYMVQLAAALDYAHNHGIVHRDVKPDNVFVLADGTVKIGDFGIAQASGIDDGVTKTNESIIGSVHYLAPEIIEGKMATEQSDIYALGVTFFECITGHPPYEKDSAVNIAVAHINEKFPSVRKYIPNFPKEIDKIIAKATKKKRSERYRTMKSFYEDLNEVLQHPELMKEQKGFISRFFGFK